VRYLLLAILLLSLSGCGLFKEQTGAFVSEAVADHIAEKVDARLDRRGLSIDKIKNVTDLNNDGKVDLAEVARTAKLAAGELLIAQTSTWEREQQEKWRRATENLVTRDEEAGLKGDVQDFWLWLKATIGLLVTTIGGYLTKQVFSAKSDGRRDAEIAKGHARMDALERLTGRDLDHDGMIGANGTPVATPEVEA
jgi:hypothetical protein